MFALAANAQLWAGTVATGLLAAGQALGRASHAILEGALVLVGARTWPILKANTTLADNIAAAHTLARIHNQHLVLGADGRRFVQLPVKVLMIIAVDRDQQQQQQQLEKQQR